MPAFKVTKVVLADGINQVEHVIANQTTEIMLRARSAVDVKIGHTSAANAAGDYFTMKSGTTLEIEIPARRQTENSLWLLGAAATDVEVLETSSTEPYK